MSERSPEKSALATYGGKLLGSFATRGNGAGDSTARPPNIPEALPAADFEMMVVDVGKLWISRRDEVMRPYMARAGTWEPEEGKVLRSLTKPGCRFLDIGANMGYFSVLVSAAAPGVRVEAVEPDPTNVRVLRFNLWFNLVNGTVWPLALDDSSRALHLSDNEHNLGDLRTGRVDGGGENAAAKWVVPAGSGDELFAGRSFDLVKIDTQGWEFEILIGLDGTLRRSPGVRIVAEFCPQILKDRGRDPLEVLTRYRELGYEVRAVVHGEPADLANTEITQVCASGGREGAVNLLLSR
jgi:FkbM family methyltransferase